MPIREPLRVTTNYVYQRLLVRPINEVGCNKPFQQ